MKIGVLAMQGGYDAHLKMLNERMEIDACPVRVSEELEQVDALILPGGESTTIIKLLQRIGLDEVIKARASAGMPIFGTCAGMILLAKRILDRPEQPTLGLMEITVARNAFGRQVDSFEADIQFNFAPIKSANSPDNDEVGAENLGDSDEYKSKTVRGVFIRAPYIIEKDETVETLGVYRDKIVAVRQKNLLATAFHPELTEDTRVHREFVKMIKLSQERR